MIQTMDILMPDFWERQRMQEEIVKKQGEKQTKQKQKSDKKKQKMKKKLLKKARKDMKKQMQKQAKATATYTEVPSGDTNGAAMQTNAGMEMGTMAILVAACLLLAMKLRVQNAR